MSREDNLKPCPFCGDRFKYDACDRLISIKCETCNYSRGFKGILQVNPRQDNDNPIPKRKTIQYGVWPFKGSREIVVEGKDQTDGHKEYYHYDANDMAINEMNKRVIE